MTCVNLGGGSDFVILSTHAVSVCPEFLLACLQCGRPGFDPWVGKIPWRRKWQSTLGLLPGKSHGQRSLVGYSPRGHKEQDTTERLHFHFSLSCTEEGNGNPLQCSCLENPRDGGAWWAAVYGVAQSQTRLKRLSSSSSSSRGLPCGSDGKEFTCQCRRCRFDWEDLLEKGMAPHSSILAWRIPWTEEPGRLQSMSHKELDPKQLTQARASNFLLLRSMFQPCFISEEPITLKMSQDITCSNSNPVRCHLLFQKCI